MRTCDTCRHWDDDPNRKPDGHRIADETGVCSRPDRPEEGALAFTLSGSGSGVRLLTGSQFGCVLHEAIPEIERDQDDDGA